MRRHRGGRPPAGTSLPELLELQNGRYRMPQGLLPWFTEACQRKRMPYKVVDQRATRPCPTVRSRCSLDPQQHRTVRRLLLRDAGVLVASGADRLALVAELVARRQQRTLLVTRHAEAVASWRQQLAATFDLKPPQLVELDHDTPGSRLVVGHYQQVLKPRSGALSRGFGMVIFDGLDRMEPTVMVRTIRASGSRYLLGLAENATRRDGMHEHIFLLLGETVVHQQRDAAPSMLPLGLRSGVTAFSFDYNGRQQYQALLAALAHDTRRAELVCGDILAQTEDGARCLVLSDRRDHLNLLQQRLGDKVSCEQLSFDVRAPRRRDVVDRFDRGQTRVLLATRQGALENFDTPAADRLLLTFPFAYANKLEPLVRLLVRPRPGGKKDALLVDYNDPGVEPLARSFARRQEIFRRMKRKLNRRRAGQSQLNLPLD